MGVLDGRRVVVVGASAGIGRAFAVHAAAEGARVVAVARRADRLEELVDGDGRRHGGRRRHQRGRRLPPHRRRGPARARRGRPGPARGGDGAAEALRRHHRRRLAPRARHQRHRRAPGDQRGAPPARAGRDRRRAVVGDDRSAAFGPRRLQREQGRARGVVAVLAHRAPQHPVLVRRGGVDGADRVRQLLRPAAPRRPDGRLGAARPRAGGVHGHRRGR